ncbi:MAG: MATE family efflux transporter, partial [Elusimicrobiota bacterium]|nr:MATE family efflux transporter [Elusimicrobiota bacterium]
MQKIKTFLKQFPRHWVVAASAWTSKIIVALVQIVSIRTLLFYLGEDRYAVYLIAYSLTAWLGIAGFSMGTALQNFISECRAQNKSYDGYLLAILQITTVLFIALILIIACISPIVQEKLFDKFSYIDEIRNLPIVFVLGIISIVSTLCMAVYSFYFAIHKGYISNIMPAFAACISMILIVIFNRLSLYNGIMTALLIFTLPQAFLALILFIKIFKSFFSKLFSVNIYYIKEIWIRSLKFHGIIVMSGIYGLLDYLIMSQTLNSNEIVSYNIFMRIFSSALYMFNSLMGAVWPVLSEKYARKEFSDIKKILKNNILYGVILMFLCAVFVYIFRDFIVKLLAPGKNIDKSAVFLALIAIYMLLRIVYDALNTFLQSINAV